MDIQEWKIAQKWEADWWGNCTRTWPEEIKQMVYASRMGLIDVSNGLYSRMPLYKLSGQSVVDIGGGPISLLLKCEGYGAASVVDPGDYPSWVTHRYYQNGITYYKNAAEEFIIGNYNEAWIYNVLQHVIDPYAVIQNAKRASKIIRIFEWIETPPSQGHPHTIHQKELNQWLQGEGMIEQIDEGDCRGLAYYGIFKGDRYEQV
jgi:2-polyprenyl-3-methyl-5-hydroxy-6-metoxy-1,4-benzoquinol methylase